MLLSPRMPTNWISEELAHAVFISVVRKVEGLSDAERRCG
jgi:hypothetical protein